MNAFEKALTRKIGMEVPDLAAVTPGIVLDVHVGGRRKGLVRVGTTYEYYDLASLTKIIFTASACIHHFSQYPRALHQPVCQVLPWWKAPTTPADLLTHSAGLDWWKPYYKGLHGPKDPQQRWDQLKARLGRAKPSRRRGRVRSLYSDLDLWMIGAYLEAAENLSLTQMWRGVEERLKLANIFFHPRNRPRYARSRYAPTEKCKWRKRVMRGEVHDENTWALGGVAPHAGLFGDIESVSDWGLKLRAAVLHEQRRFGDPAMVRRFVRRQIPRAQGDWGLGFMKPSLGRASCGRYFRASSFGHTGFTGTSLWFDPVQDILIVILSNRVHPTRDNKEFVALRPRLHEWICQLL